MWYPETEQNLADEARIAAEFAGRRGFTAHKIAGTARIDRALINHAGVVIAFAEVKTCRYCFQHPSFGGGYKIHIDKYRAATWLNWATDRPVYLVVEFTDALAALDMTAVAPELEHKIYRQDRDETQDAALFHWASFRILTRRELVPA